MKAATHHAPVVHVELPTNMAQVELRFKRLHTAAKVPAYQTSQAAGMDLSACVPDGPVVVLPGEIKGIPCGFAMAIPVGFEAQIRPRSGLAIKHGISMPNTPGTIDSDYRGQVIVPIINHGREPFTVTDGMRIAQMVIAPVIRAQVVEVDELDETARGSGGFGSTGR
ncbi:MAG TPA: dUTP diphosphatase [Phycisphaerales bacterium]|nr:dUTP diphosphatase [Phycisphaerales bacterium]